MKYFIITFITGLALVFLLLNNPIITGQVIATTPVYETLAPITFNEQSQQGTLLDIRTPQEFNSGRILGSSNIDFYSPNFEEKLDSLDKSETYYIYCRTGSRTSQTLTLMRELGFQNVYELEGGITNWASQGLPIY